MVIMDGSKQKEQIRLCPMVPYGFFQVLPVSKWLREDCHVSISSLALPRRVKAPLLGPASVRFPGTSGPGAGTFSRKPTRRGIHMNLHLLKKKSLEILQVLLSLTESYWEPLPTLPKQLSFPTFASSGSSRSLKAIGIMSVQLWRTCRFLQGCS